VTYTIRFSRSARRALENELPESVATACVEFIYGALAENPHRIGKQLNPPSAPHYSARRGQFRVIYDIYDNLVVVEIVTVQHRRDVYRNLS
jgi:mRNA interferase RelE/StbE